MSAGEYLAGAAFFAGELALVGAGSWLLVRHRLAYLRGTDRALALAMIFTAGVIAAHVIPLALGILSRPAVLVTAGVLAGGARLVARRGPGEESDAAPYPEAQPSEGRLLRVAGWAVPAYAGVITIAYLTTVATAAVVQVDFMEFHGPHVAHWIQEGSLWEILSLYPTHHTGYDPHNGEVLLLAVALPWRSDFLFRFVDVPYLLVTWAALTSMARHLGVGAHTALLWATLVVLLPTTLLLAVITAKPDPVLMATFATGCLFLLRHSRSAKRGDLVVAGLALGLAFGSKWNGLTAVVVVLALWSVARLVFGVSRPRVIRETAGVGVLTLAAGGIWFVRNAVATGNPVFPVKVELGGITLFDAPRDLQFERYGDSLSDYITDWTALSDYIWPPIYEYMLGPAGVFMVAALLVSAGVGLVAWFRSREDPVTRRVAVLAVAVLVLGLVYVITPFTAQTFNGVPARAWVTVRYGAPALLLAAPLAAWATGRAGRLRPLILAALVLAVLEASDRSLNGRFADVTLGRTVLVALGMALVGGAGLAVARTARSLDRRGRRWVVAGTAGVVVAGLLAVGYVDQERFLERRYLRTDPTLAWIQQNAPEGQRIGLVGEWIPVDFSPPLALYGPRLRNEVVFVGPDRDGIVDEYRSAGALVRAVERQNVDFVLVQDRPPSGQSENERWLRAAGWSAVVSSPNLVLLRR